MSQSISYKKYVTFAPQSSATKILENIMADVHDAHIKVLDAQKKLDELKAKIETASKMNISPSSIDKIAEIESQNILDILDDI
jgi:hypothetical protein